MIVFLNKDCLNYPYTGPAIDITNNDMLPVLKKFIFRGWDINKIYIIGSNNYGIKLIVSYNTFEDNVINEYFIDEKTNKKPIAILKKIIQKEICKEL